MAPFPSYTLKMLIWKYFSFTCLPVSWSILIVCAMVGFSVSTSHRAVGPGLSCLACHVCDEKEKHTLHLKMYLQDVSDLHRVEGAHGHQWEQHAQHLC